MRFCVIDCETVPNTTLPNGVKPEFDASSVKLGNIKDEGKRLDKLEQAADEFDKALDKKMSLDPDLCEVVCFVGKCEDSIWYSNNVTLDYIERAWDFIKHYYLAHIPLVSFNGIGFDLPILLHQAMRLNIPVSPQMYSDLTKRYDNRWHYDLMQILAGWDKSKWKPLAFYLKLFDIGAQVGEGSDVYDWWKAGEYDKIREHCENDVKMTAQLFERLKDWIVNEERYDESPI